MGRTHVRIKGQKLNFYLKTHATTHHMAKNSAQKFGTYIILTCRCPLNKNKSRFAHNLIVAHDVKQTTCCIRSICVFICTYALYDFVIGAIAIPKPRI